MYEYLEELKKEFPQEDVDDFMAYLDVSETVLDHVMETALTLSFSDGDCELVGEWECMYNISSHSGSHVAAASVWSEDRIVITFTHLDSGEEVCWLHINMKGGNAFGTSCEFDIDYDKDFNYKVDKPEEKENNDMASLSQRVEAPQTAEMSVEDTQRYWVVDSSSKFTQAHNIKYIGENNMTLRTITATLIDNNPNLKAQERIVFQEKEFLTEYDDAQTLQNIIATGKVKEALDKHNALRADVTDKAILKTTGVKVPLDPIELIAELEWSVVRNA